jgi:hypothetical protein
MKLRLFICLIIIGSKLFAQTDSATFIKEYAPSMRGFLYTEQLSNGFAIHYLKANALHTEIYTDSGEILPEINIKPEGLTILAGFKEIGVSSNKYAIQEKPHGILGKLAVDIRVYPLGSQELYKYVSFAVDRDAILKNSSMKSTLGNSQSRTSYSTSWAVPGQPSARSNIPTTTMNYSSAPVREGDSYKIDAFIDNSLILKFKTYSRFINTYITTPAIIDVSEELPRLKYIQPKLSDDETEPGYKYERWEWVGSLKKDAHVFMRGRYNSAQAFKEIEIDTFVGMFSIVNDHSMISKSFDIPLVAPSYMITHDYIAYIDNKFEHCIYLFAQVKNIATKKYTFIGQKISFDGRLLWQSVAPEIGAKMSSMTYGEPSIMCLYDHNHSPYLFIQGYANIYFDKETGKSMVGEHKGNLKQYTPLTISDTIKQKADNIKAQNKNIITLHDVFVQNGSTYMLFYCKGDKFQMYKY